MKFLWKSVKVNGLPSGLGRVGVLLSSIAYLEQTPVNFGEIFSQFVLKNDRHYPISGKRYPTSQQCLWALSKITQPESYLEIGTRYGYSLGAVVLGSKNLKRAVSLDIDNVQEQVKQNIKTLKNDFEPELIKADSKKFITDEKFDICYVDGDHSYEAAFNDMKKYWNNVKSQGIMAIDDTFKFRYDFSYGNVEAHKAAIDFIKQTDDIESYYLQYPSFSGFGIFIKK